MHTLLAIGLAQAWGLVCGALDAGVFSPVEFGSNSVAFRYVAAAAALQAFVSLAAGLGLRWVYSLVSRGRHKSMDGLIAVQLGAILAPLTLAVLRTVQATVLQQATVFSPAGIGVTVGVLLVSAAVGLMLTRLAAPLFRSMNPIPVFGSVSLAGYVGTVVAVFLVALSMGAARSPAETGRNLLLISIDSLRRDVFDEYVQKYASESLRQFVAGTRRYNNAHTTYSHSLPSHASMLTGRYPPEHGALMFSKGIGTDLGSPLAESVEPITVRLANKGFETIGIMTNAWLGPPYRLETGFQTHVNGGIARKINFFHPSLVTTVSVVGSYLRYADRHFVRTVHPNSRLFLNWLSTRDTARPFFAFLHYIDLHTPNDVPQEYMDRFCTGTYAEVGGRDLQRRFQSGEFSAEDMPEFRKQVRELNLASMAQIDDFLAPVLEGLQKSGLLNNTLVVFTSDHGEDLYEKSALYGHHYVHHTVSQIPFMMHVPGDTQGKLLDELVSLVDIAPTLLNFVGLMPGDGIAGINLLGETSRDETNDWVYVQGWDYSSQHWARAVIFADGFKWIEDASGHVEFYDLNTDPTETNDLSASSPTAPQYQECFLDIVDNMETVGGQPIDVENLPAEVIKQLKALGYL